ncbi:MAG TPA: pyridoxamine 5'-phosphate oxidase family protein [Desulfobacterales bacterium]|nr:pyridoxamine 5'-phosphate oxidase family protein [Desulfobacterales bacterium]
MILKEYFEKAKGTGVLSTADTSGNVDAAFYSKPYFEDEETVSFIMLDRLTHTNLQSNPKAVYLFKKEGEEFIGKRLFLIKIKEEEDEDKINELMKTYYPAWHDRYKDEKKFQVFFKITKVLPLISEK